MKQAGAPADRAKQDREDPVGMLKKYADYFDTYSGMKIANICGSCGKKAVPLAVLGADVQRFPLKSNSSSAVQVPADPLFW